MTPLLWFLLGACFGALCGVVVMALVAVSKEADDWNEEQVLSRWEDGSPKITISEPGQFTVNITSADPHLPYDQESEGP